jgi:GNAT superfamily N-acetyltransferase
MKHAVTIRPAVPADRDALGRYGAALMRQHYQYDAQRFIQVAHPEKGYAQFLVSQIDRDDSIVLVAEQAGRVVGYAFAGLEPVSWKELRGACGYLHDVYVDADARGIGTGEALVRGALHWVASKGAPRTVLWSATRNHVAQQLFAKLGFRHTMVEMTRERESND